MLIPRLLPIALRSAVAKNVGSLQKRLISTTKARSSHGPWVYRRQPEPDPKFEKWADAAGAFMWWWIFWHFLTDYHHIIGHYEFPDIGAWTDEELGVPPDDAPDPEDWELEK